LDVSATTEKRRKLIPLATNKIGVALISKSYTTPQTEKEFRRQFFAAITEHGADNIINYVDTELGTTNTLLGLAIRLEHTSHRPPNEWIINQLIDMGSDVNAINIWRGTTPLHVCAQEITHAMGHIIRTPDATHSRLLGLYKAVIVLRLHGADILAKIHRGYDGETDGPPITAINTTPQHIIECAFDAQKKAELVSYFKHINQEQLYIDLLAPLKLSHNVPPFENNDYYKAAFHTHVPQKYTHPQLHAIWAAVAAEQNCDPGWEHATHTN